MRPIRLEISGLHSFRDPQVIEFDRLLDTGVFGIFGPTGSGKSTILDAITLALYGTVERAANHTQGILNHGEERLNVKFSFSLGSGEKLREYRAERSYRRTRDKSVSAAVCRLVKKAGGQENVLVSKEKEMTKAVSELLGLNVEDFTRAVVLPQGKFAEFLTIKPRDRREMLERLFALEAYGKGLAKKLTDRQNRAEFDLNGIVQRQLGLGDASPTRLEEAKVELDGALIEAAAAEQQLALLRTGQEEAKVVWALQEELETAKQREGELAAAKEGIERLEARLALAEKAETLRPLLHTLKSARENSEAAVAEGKRLEEQRSLAAELCTVAFARWEASRQERVETEPEWVRQLERLEQARRDEKVIEGQRQELEKKQQEYRRLAATRSGLADRLASVAQGLENEKKNLQALKEHLSEITISPAEREKINHAAQALKAYQVLAKRLQEEERLYQESQAELATIEAGVQEIQLLEQHAQEKLDTLKLVRQNRQSAPSQEREISQRALALEQYRARLLNLLRLENEEAEANEALKQEIAELSRSEEGAAGLERDYQEALRTLEAAQRNLEKQKAALKDLENQNQAGLLAGELKEGLPCPVCGSAHHPHPTAPLAQEARSRAEGELQEAERDLAGASQSSQEIATKLAVLRSRIAVQRENLEKSKLFSVGKTQESFAQRKAFAPDEQKLQAAELRVKLEDAERGLAAEQESLLRFTQEGEKLSQDVAEAEADLAQVKEKAEQIRLRHAATQRALEDLGRRRADMREELKREQAELDAARGSVKTGEILGLQKQYTLWDQENVNLRALLDTAEAKIQSFDREQITLREEETAQELALKELEVGGREMRKVLTELESKLRLITGGEPASRLLSEKQAALERIRRTDEENRIAKEQAEQGKNQAEQDYAVWERELRLKQQSLQEAEEQLQAGLKETGFVTVTAVENALADGSERLKMREASQRFRQEEVRMREKQAEREAKLSGRRISPGEWLTWPLRIQEAEDRQRLAMQRSGAASDVLQRLQERQVEWTDLEQERKALSHRLELIKNLQSVFRGNAFVEFIAEEQLVNVAYDASERLALLTNYRYALEVDSESGFIIRDDANGGFRRPVSSLSGGETFLTSLALALALSCQIQLHGEAPLEFFFLDEGFGTLDNSLLEIVMTTLEKLHLQNLTIGIISHVPELRSRLARRLIVEAAEPGGAGSRVRLERA